VKTRFALALCGLLMAGAASAREDIVIADFEGETYGRWTVEGAAFGPGPAPGTLPGQMAVDGYDGKRLVNSFYGGDGATGRLTSPPFTIERPFINFLAGGGKYPGQTCIDLLVDGRPVRTATGPNDKPGGSEKLDWVTWDVSEFEGKTAVIRIVDEATGGWGHINVDHIVQSDKKAPIPVEKTRELTLEKPYLNLPVQTGARKVHVRVEVDGRSVRAFDIELAPAEPDFWVTADVRPFIGQKALLRVDRLPEDSKALDAVRTADGLIGAENLYREPLRPQFHFSSRRGWNNDPNGLVYHDGEYHLFYQHNPYGRAWGNMHWGHAVSPDLVHWTELGDALYPDEMGTMFSGSAVVDSENTAGFGKDAIVCIYTAAGGTSPESEGQPFTQCIAYSTDRGRTWTKYAGNPVLGHIVGGNRDPKVIRHAPTQSWVMALYLDADVFALFGSKDLKSWERLSDVAMPGTNECPEFFEIPVDGSPGETRWVFYGGNGRYLVGRFDGRTFTPESGPHPFNFGNCFYASQTYNGVPDGRRIQVAWGQVDLTDMPFNQTMDLPVELTLRSTADGPRLFALPVREVESLRTESFERADLALSPEANPLAEVEGELFDIEAELDPGQASEIGFKVRGTELVYDARKQELRCLDKTAPLAPVDGRIRLRLLVDRASIEIFANDGRIYMPMGVLLPREDRSLALFARGGDARVARLAVHGLKSAWDAAPAP